MAIYINGKIELMEAKTLRGSRANIRMSRQGEYYRICYENALRMYKGRRNKQRLALKYADNCIKVNQMAVI